MSTTVETPSHSGAPLDREPGSGRRLRYMGRRRIRRTDRNGDALGGVFNLFDVAVVLAVAVLLAALTGVGLSGILSSKNVIIVTNPGQSDMQVITKNGTQITRLDLRAGQQVSGLGILVGQFYRLPGGTTVYVPSGGGTVAPTPGATSTSAPAVAVTPTPPGVVITPTPGSPPTGAPGTVTPGVTATPTVAPSGATPGP